MQFIKRIKHKLNSKKGASILIALLLMLVCLLVSVSVLSAAMANVVHVKDERESNEKMLNLEKAIKVLTEANGDMVYYYRSLSNWTNDCGHDHISYVNSEDLQCRYGSYRGSLSNGDQSGVMITGSASGTSGSGECTAMTDRIESMAYKIANGQSYTENGPSFSMEFYDSAEPIYVTLSMDDRFYLTMTLQFKADPIDPSDASEQAKYYSVYEITYTPNFSYRGESPNVVQGTNNVYTEDIILTEKDVNCSEDETKFAYRYTRNELYVTWSKDNYTVRKVS